MTRIIKSTTTLFAGFCSFAAAVGFGFLLVRYFTQGAGLRVFGFYFGLSSLTVLLGLIRVAGFAMAAFLCVAIGIGLCAHGLVPPSPGAGTGGS